VKSDHVPSTCSYQPLTVTGSFVGDHSRAMLSAPLFQPSTSLTADRTKHARMRVPSQPPCRRLEGAALTLRHTLPADKTHSGAIGSQLYETAKCEAFALVRRGDFGKRLFREQFRCAAHMVKNGVGFIVGFIRARRKPRSRPFRRRRPRPLRLRRASV
jgi:hypothetical protein